MKEGGGEEGKGGQQCTLCLTKGSPQLLSLLGGEEGRRGKGRRSRAEKKRWKDDWGGQVRKKREEERRG